MAIEKRCKICKKKKNIKEFYEQKSNKDGYNLTCKKCILKKQKKYRENNIDKFKEKDKIYYEKNKEKIKIRTKKYSEKNKIKKSEYNKKWREKNKEKLKIKKNEYYKKNRKEKKEYILKKEKKYRDKNREKIREYSKNYTKDRMNNDPEFKLQINIRDTFNSAFKRKTKTKEKRFFQYTGIEYIFYTDHLKKDPLWNDYCNGENIHIDHIIPVSAYDFSDPDEIKKCWSPENLRLLDATENLEKHAKIDIELIKQYNIIHLLPEGLKNL